MTYFHNEIKTCNAQECTILVNRETNQILEVKHIKTIISLDGCVSHYFEHKGEQIIVPEGSKSFTMVRDIANFQHGEALVPKTVFITEHVQQIHFRFLNTETPGDCDIVSVCIINGIPAQIATPLKGWIMKSTETRFEPLWVTGTEIEKYYRDVEAAVKFNDCKIIDASGNEKTIPGLYSYIMPDDNQMAALNTLKNAIQQAKNAGLHIFYDTYNDKMYAINSKKASMRYDDFEPDQTVFLMQEEELPNELYLGQINYCNSEDRYGIIEIPEKENE